jgi:hypothetical protein
MDKELEEYFKDGYTSIRRLEKIHNKEKEFIHADELVEELKRGDFTNITDQKFFILFDLFQRRDIVHESMYYYNNNVMNEIIVKYIKQRRSDKQFLHIFMNYSKLYAFGTISTIIDTINSIQELSDEEFIIIEKESNKNFCYIYCYLKPMLEKGNTHCTNELLKIMVSKMDHNTYNVKYANKFDYILGHLVIDSSIDSLEILCLLDPQIGKLTQILNEKVIPNDTCIYNLCFRNNFCISFKNKLNKRFRRHGVKFPTIDDIIKLFVEYGYVMNQKMFEYMVEKNLFLSDPLSFNLQITPKILEMYINNGELFKNYESIISKQDQLTMLFKEKGNMKKIKELIKTEKLSPNINCLRLACSIKNKQYICFIIDTFEVKPDIECIAFFISKSTCSKTLKLLLETAVKN